MCGVFGRFGGKTASNLVIWGPREELDYLVNFTKPQYRGNNLEVKTVLKIVVQSSNKMSLGIDACTACKLAHAVYGSNK